MKITDAMVLAAGLGTRLRPVTDTIPKPLVKVAGKAMIEYALDLLAEAGVERVVVNVHHHAEQMIGYLERYPRLQVIISDERTALMNSGGGLAKGLRLLGDATVFVMNADLFWIGDKRNHGSNLERLAAFFDSTRMDMALLCADPDHTSGHNGKNDFNLDEQGRLTRYQPGDARPVVYAGALVMNPSLLNDAPPDAFNLNIYFDRAIAKGRLFGLTLDGHWITVGTPEAIGEAEDAIRRLQN